MGADERVGLGDRAIDVRLGGEVDHRVDAVDRLGDRVGVLDRAVHEGVLDVLEVLAPPGVGQLVEDDDLVAAVAHAHAHEVRADEAGAATDQELHAGTLSERWAATPSCQRGSRTGSVRSVPSTL